MRNKTLKAAQEALRVLEYSIGSVEQAAKIIRNRKGDIVVTGIGKSGFIGQKLTATLTSLGERAFYLHPTDALHGDLGALSEGDVLVAFSFSGESKEVVGLTRYAKKAFKAKVIAVTRSQESSLGKMADLVVKVNVLSEGSPNEIAPMASTTAMLVAADMIAGSVVSPKFKNEHYAKYHPGGALGLSLKNVKEVMSRGTQVPKILESKLFSDALREMSKKRLGITAIINARGAISGVITDGDVRRFVLRVRDVSKALAKDAMTREPKYITEDTTFQDALSAMENNKVTSLFVVDGKNKLTGIVHIHQILSEMV